MSHNAIFGRLKSEVSGVHQNCVNILVGADGRLPLARRSQHHLSDQYNTSTDFIKINGVSIRASRLRLYAVEYLMSRFNYFYLIKRQAKLLAKAKSIQLSAAQAIIASDGGFDHYHELQQVAKNNPDDARLMRLALETDDLAEVVFSEDIYGRIDCMLESELSSHIAETNAEGFCIDELIVEKAEYDQSTGVLSISAKISYVGDQKPDRPFSGTKFNLSVAIRLFRHVSNWEFLDDDGLQITNIVSDQELDWQQQLEKDSLTIEALKSSAAFNAAEALKSSAAFNAAEALKSSAAFNAAEALKSSSAFNAAEALKSSSAFNAAEALKSSSAFNAAEALKSSSAFNAAEALKSSSAFNAAEALKSSSAFNAAEALKDATSAIKSLREIGLE